MIFPWIKLHFETEIQRLVQKNDPNTYAIPGENGNKSLNAGD